MKNYNFDVNKAALWISEGATDLMSTLSFGGGGGGDDMENINHNRRCRKMKTISRFFWRSVFWGFLPMISAAQTESMLAESARKIELVGHIEGKEVETLVDDLYQTYLTHPVITDKAGKLAIRLELYISPSIVTENRFTPPPEAGLSKEYLDTYSSVFPPNEECIIRRRFFENPEEYIVVVIDGSDSPEKNDLELCILGGILSALGEELHNTPKYSIAQMRQVTEDFFEN